MLKINWKKINELKKHLLEKGFDDNFDLLFIMILKNGQPRKSVIKFKDLSKYFWAISESQELNIEALVIQDVKGNVIYRHKNISFNEEIPNEGNGDIIKFWSKLQPIEKDMYLRMLISQIKSYE